MKWMRTPHLPWSPGMTSDDKRIETVSFLQLAPSIVISEKIDGECTSMTNKSCFARSENSDGSAPWRHQVMSTWGGIAHLIPEGIQLVGENAYAKHSILYERLPAYFMVFAAMDLNRGVVLSWWNTADLAEELGLKHVPIHDFNVKFDEVNFDSIAKMKSKAGAEGGIQEGYVVRDAGEFPISEFGVRVAKYVRAGHVQTDSHWTQGPIVKNTLAFG